jgi:hypothetical protein
LLNITISNDFEGGNLKWCQITDYDPIMKKIYFNIWLNSDFDLKDIYKYKYSYDDIILKKEQNKDFKYFLTN